MDKKLATATFGAALATMGVAPELQADIISLSFNPGSIGTGNLFSVSIVELGAFFSQWNDSIGKTIYAGSLSSIAPASFSQNIDPTTFYGTFGLGLLPSATGVFYLGFRYLGNVGWFSFDAGGFLGNITYLEGAYGTMGEPVHVGTIPSPSGLAVLALGAAGIRRKRR
jgi:hypothetical protein